MTEHAAYNADCFDILPQLETDSVDFVFADLPYGTTQNKWDTPIDLGKLWPELSRVCKENAAMCFTCQQPFTTTLIASNLKRFRYEWIWEKPHATGHLNAKRMPMKAHENIAVFYRRLPTYNPQKTEGHKNYRVKAGVAPATSYNDHVRTATSSRDGTRYPRTVLSAGQQSKASQLHPTQKPVSLAEYMIKTYTNEGDLVLDPTAGVLTTRVAARNTGRRSCVIELDGEYFAKGMKR